MKSHLDIKISGHSTVLPRGFSLDIEEKNPLFHDQTMFSHPAELPLDGNREIFQNVEDDQSDLRPVGLEHQPVLISAEGMPLRSGTVVITEGEELRDTFSFNIDQSTQSLRDLIGDLKCREVPLYNNEKIPIGEKICNVKVKLKAEVDVHVTTIKGTRDFDLPTQYIEKEVTFEPQALGFSYPGRAVKGSGSNNDKISTAEGGVKSYPDFGNVNVPKVVEDYINVSEPYGSGWKYCNARVCYTHYGLDKSAAKLDTASMHGDHKTVGTIGKTTDEVMKVDERFYSVNEDYGPYWVLDARRPQSGICFYVLYFLDCLFAHLGLDFDKSVLMAIEDFRRLAFFTTHCHYVTEPDEERPSLNTTTAINQWLDERGCGGRIEIPDPEDKSLDNCHYYDPDEKRWYDISKGTLMFEDLKASGKITWSSVSAKVGTMYATSENFPDAAVTDVLDGLEQSFGIKFNYDYEHRRVTAYLLRHVFRSHGSPVSLPCRILEMNKLAEKITGVRVKYSAESDGTEQSRNVRTAKRDYDTDFDYIDYPQIRTQVDDGYIQIAKDRRTENMTVYIDRLTGNSYRWKISKETTTGDVSEHRLFEVGQFKGIEVGDCSPENEDYIHEMISPLQPMSFNDVNAYAEMVHGSTQPILAAYVDEDMEHEFVTQKINHPVDVDFLDFYATEVLRTVESYDPSGTEDGNSPLQSYDWGLAVALMRGGGADATIERYDYDYDGFGNAKWRTVAGNYALSSDSMDQFGNTFDYNGEQSGTGGGERFSLKIRSYKQPSWADGPLCVADRDVRMRGLADVFLSEWIYFLLHRKKFRIHCLMEVAQLADIPNHWHERFLIGGKAGWIDSLKYSLTAEEGVSEVEIDFYAF